jgi:hypothetical protein
MEAAERASQPPVGDSPSRPFDLRWFDFWILFGAGTAALTGLTLSRVATLPTA